MNTQNTTKTNLYRVYNCVTPTDMWSYDEDSVILETDCLSKAHGFSYDLWKKDTTLAYVIIQVSDDSCRGGYGAWTKD